MTEELADKRGGLPRRQADRRAGNPRFDKLAVRIIRPCAHRWPMTLREVIAALKIAGVVERIGRLFQEYRQAGRNDRMAAPGSKPLTLLPAIGRTRQRDGCTMCSTAYAARDSDLAREVIATDAKVDAFYRQQFFRNSRQAN